MPTPFSPVLTCPARMFDPMGYINSISSTPHSSPGSPRSLERPCCSPVPLSPSSPPPHPCFPRSLAPARPPRLRRTSTPLRRKSRLWTTTSRRSLRPEDRCLLLFKSTRTPRMSTRRSRRPRLTPRPRARSPTPRDRRSSFSSRTSSPSSSTLWTVSLRRRRPLLRFPSAESSRSLRTTSTFSARTPSLSRTQSSPLLRPPFWKPHRPSSPTLMLALRAPSPRTHEHLCQCATVQSALQDVFSFVANLNGKCNRGAGLNSQTMIDGKQQ